MPVQVMKSVNMNSKNIVNNVGIFNDNAAMNNILSEEYRDEQRFL